jgi:hypothetical protein
MKSGCEAEPTIKPIIVPERGIGDIYKLKGLHDYTTFPIIIPRYWYTSWEFLGYHLCRVTQRSLKRLQSLSSQAFFFLRVCQPALWDHYICSSVYADLWTFGLFEDNVSTAEVAQLRGGMESSWIVCGYGFGRIIFEWILEKRTVIGRFDSRGSK